MHYENPKVADVASALKARLEAADKPVDLTKAPELKALYAEIPLLPPAERGSFGKQLNQLKQELADLAESGKHTANELPPIDITAPFEANTQPIERPALLPAATGSTHPLMQEIEFLSDIFYRMGFSVESSRELDDDYHMFESLNFPEGHPARDDFDTFMTTDGFVAPAHTSTMQNRIMRKYAANLAQGQAIAAVVPDRVFRNEDLDATHEHTFYQLEGIYVNKGITVGHLIATLKEMLSAYYGEELQTKIQPFYFPFTEPSFEFAIERPHILRKDDSEEQKWLELGGCGMIHPNVLRMAGIDPNAYSGFAWGFGVDRLVMLKYGIEDVRHFESAKLDFLRQFS